MNHRYILLAAAVGFLSACASFLPSDTQEDVNTLIPSDTVQTEPVVESSNQNKDDESQQSEVGGSKSNENDPKVSELKAGTSKPVVKIDEPVIEIKTIGQIEYVDILPEGIRQKARIDTGAETTSIGALDIENFERDGKSWVKFNVLQRRSGKITEFVKPIVRNVLIKRHGAKNVRRPVIKMTLAIGSIKKKIEVSLTSRSKFEFPVLIGRNFLYGDIRVDVSNKFLMLDK